MLPCHLDPRGLRLAPYRGGLAVLGRSLDAACPDSRSSGPPHITLLTPAEAKAHPPPAHPSPPLEHIYVLGTVSRGLVTFAVAVWVHGNAARRSLGLGPKDFHVTLSAADDHSIPKGVDALPLDIDGIAALGLDALDHVFLSDPAWQRALSERMVLDYPGSFKGFVRLAAVCAPKLACMAYARAAVLNPALKPRIAKELRRRRTEASYGPTLTEAERASTPAELLPHLAHPWPDLAIGFWPHAVELRQPQLFNGHILPPSFSFVYPRICASAAPSCAEDVRALEALGVTHVLTLTAEAWLLREWFDPTEVENVYLAVPSEHPPTLTEMDAVLARIRMGGTWLVHCDDGTGRTGTVLACLLAALGEDGDSVGSNDDTPKLDAARAIGLVRAARPGSVKSERQERFVAQWVAHRWAPPAVPEPATALEVSGDVSWRVLVLVGRPGSGKTWFAQALAKRAGVVVVGENDGCSRASSLRDFAHFAQHPVAGGFVVLDLCNVSRAERAVWLAVCEKPVAVWFDCDPDLCRQRIAGRVGDIRRPGCERNILEELNGSLDPPTSGEFAGVLRISSIAAAREAVARLVPMPIIEFPHIPHLFSLGSAAHEGSSNPGLAIVGRLAVEEKLDGISIGVSLDFSGFLRVQYRGQWVTAADGAQFKHLDTWLEKNERALRRVLGRDEVFPERFTVFGEWMEATHSVRRSEMPGAFFAFDLYDRAAPGGPGFVARDVLERHLCGEIPLVPLVRQCETLNSAEVLAMLDERSAFGDRRRQGVVVRWEEGDYVFRRGKVMRGGLRRRKTCHGSAGG